MAGGGRLPATHYRKSADRQLGRTKLSSFKEEKDQMKIQFKAPIPKTTG